jgi:hypothetical protein
MAGTALRGLSSRDYEHPYDRRALTALESNSALGAALGKLNQYGIDRVLRVQYAGSNVRATRRSFGEACDALAEACAVLDISRPPELYVEWDEHPWAQSVCTDRPLIVMSSRLLEMMGREELLFAIGHELGHVKSRHIAYGQMALALPVLGDLLKSATLGIGGLLSGGLQLSLNNWVRMSDFSADRAGLLACHDAAAACRALIKLGGLPRGLERAVDVEGFMAQAREFGGYDFETLDKLARIVSAFRARQQWTVMRASEMLRWYDTGAYTALVGRTLAAAATAEIMAKAKAAAASAAAASLAMAAGPAEPSVGAPDDPSVPEIEGTPAATDAEVAGEEPRRLPPAD